MIKLLTENNDVSVLKVRRIYLFSMSIFLFLAFISFQYQTHGEKRFITFCGGEYYCLFNVSVNNWQAPLFQRSNFVVMYICNIEYYPKFYGCF